MNSRLLILSAFLLFSNNAWPEADGPDSWRVTNVLPGSFLNMRKGPSKKFAVVARVPHDATELENRGCSPDFNASEWAEFTVEESNLALTMRWCRVIYKDVSGWVHSRFLSE